MNERKNKLRIFINVWMSIVILLGVLLPSIGSPIEANAQTKTDSKDILSNLTDAQRLALKEIEVNNSTGLQLNSNINLESDAEVSVIVEFQQKPADAAQLEAQLQGKSLLKKQAKQNIDNDHKKFKSDLNKYFNSKKSSYKLNKSYKHAFNGVAMTLPANMIESLLDSDAVKRVWSNDTVQLAPPIEVEAADGSTPLTAISEANSYLNVDKLHEAGYTGEGIDVAVIDTGIDYNHPDLKDVYKGGYDLVDDDDNPMETTYQDWKASGRSEFYKGSSYYTNHGTHVSGIIAGQGTNNSEYATTGVAPDVGLYAYRVLGPYGSGSTEDVLAGIDRAVADGMDVLNLSLGAGINDPIYPTSLAIDYAVLSGITAVVAAGNSGNDNYTIGSPGAAALALTVGASDVPVQLATFNAEMTTDEESIIANLRLMAKAYSDDMTEFQGNEYQIEYANIGQPTDYDQKDVEGKFVLIKRGEISLQAKIEYAKQKGAVGTIIYNNNPEEGHIPYYLGESTDSIPTFSLNNEEGVQLREGIAKGHYTLSFNELYQTSTEGDSLADFSSRGPTRINYDIKPEIIAPGVAILSTVPPYVIDEDNQSDYQYSYQRLSGTSMASPFVAGVAALMLQANPDLQPEDIKTVMMNTADPLANDYSVFEVGAGRVDPFEAVHANMQITVQDETPITFGDEETTIREETGAISFGSFGNNGKKTQDKRSLVLSNNSDEDKTFEVTVQFNEGRNGSQDATQNDVSIKTSSKIKLKANKTKETNVSITVPDDAENGTYEGHIIFKNILEREESYQVPFGIRVLEEGIEDLFLKKPIMTTNQNDGNPIFAPALLFGFQLKSHMKHIDVVLVDAETDEDVGYVGWLDGISIKENLPYGWLAYDGSYKPFTNSEYHPISDKIAYADQGHYKLKFIGKNDAGETFEIEEDFFVDNEKPTFSTNINNQAVIEVSEDQSSIPLSMDVFDDTVAEMKEIGFDINQSQNTIAIANNGFTGYPNIIENVDENGHIEYDMAISKRNYMTVYIDGMDGATNRAHRESFVVIKEGTPYITGELDKPTVNPGEEATYTLTGNNLDDLGKVQYRMKIKKSQVEVVDVQVRPEMKELADITVEHESRPMGTDYVDEVYTLTMDNKQGGISGDISMIDVTLKVKDKEWLKETGFLTFSTVLTDSEGNWEYAQPFFDKINVLPTLSRLQGFAISQGLLTESNAWNDNIDYSEIGAEVKITNAEGKEWMGNLNDDSRYLFNNAPISKKTHTVSINIPGHFTYYDTTELADRDGNGNFNHMREAYLIAGDVNKDNVIDIHDALAIQDKWGTNNRSADINFDGTVDAADMQFVQLNFLKQNSTLEYLKPGTSPEPKDKYKGTDLKSVLSELGIAN